MAVATHANRLITQRLTIQTSTAPQFVDLTDRVQQIVDASGIPLAITVAAPTMIISAGRVIPWLPGRS